MEVHGAWHTNGSHDDHASVHMSEPCHASACARHWPHAPCLLTPCSICHALQLRLHAADSAGTPASVIQGAHLMELERWPLLSAYGLEGVSAVFHHTPNLMYGPHGPCTLCM